jgi:hypothetical protein
MDENDRPSSFRATVINSNRSGFALFRRTAELLEEVVMKPRPHSSRFVLALDALFLQAYKTFCGVYFLAVRGHGEDAATLLRRLLEITAQIGYLTYDPNPDERESRANRYFAYNPDHRGYWWGGNIRDLFDSIGLVDTYDQDYRLLAQISHTCAQRLLFGVEKGSIQIRSAETFTPTVVFASRYVLGTAIKWNEVFNLLDVPRIASAIDEAIHFSVNMSKETPH